MDTLKAKDIDKYIAKCPPDTKKILEQIRATIRKIVPDAEETISYGIPVFTLNGTYLIYYAAYKKHIGVYPVPGRLEQIDKEFASYKTSGKGTVQFQLSKPIPLNLITRLVKLLLNENIERAAKKKQKKKSTNR